MLDVLKSVLGLSVNGHALTFVAAADPAQRHRALVDTARWRLRHAQRARDEAQRQHQAAGATVERLRELIAEAAIAGKMARAAEEADAHFTKAWAEAGASPERPSRDVTLHASAQAAQAAATLAFSLAAGAEAGLPARLSAEREAQGRVEAAEVSLRRAVADVLVATLEPRLEAMREASAVFEEGVRAVEAAARAVISELPGAASAAKEILDTIRATTPPPPRDIREIATRDDEGLIVAARPWAELARRLLNDPEAAVSV